MTPPTATAAQSFAELEKAGEAVLADFTPEWWSVTWPGETTDYKAWFNDFEQAADFSHRLRAHGVEVFAVGELFGPVVPPAPPVISQEVADARLDQFLAELRS